MKTPEEFLKENSQLLPAEQLKKYAEITAKDAVKQMHDEKEAECESLRQTLHDIFKRYQCNKCMPGIPCQFCNGAGYILP